MKPRQKTFLINGDFLCRRLTGIERYAHEITRRLDQLCAKNEIAIVIPSFLEDIPDYKNFEIIRLEKKKQIKYPLADDYFTVFSFNSQKIYHS